MDKFMCKDCGNTYELTPSEISWYEQKNLLIPKRCPECRKSRKQVRIEKYKNRKI